MPRAQAARREWNGDDVQKVNEWLASEARANFWAFRNWIHPNLIRSWYQEEVAGQ
jgi:hypothetical protein